MFSPFTSGQIARLSKGLVLMVSLVAGVAFSAPIGSFSGSASTTGMTGSDNEAFTIKSFKGNKYCELLNVTYKNGLLDFDMDLDATLDSSSKKKVLRNRCSMQVLIQLKPNYRIRTGAIALGGFFDMADDAKVRLRVGYRYDRIGNNPPKLLKWFSPKDNGPFEVKTGNKMSKWSNCGILLTLTAQSAVRIQRTGTTSDSNVIIQNAAAKHGINIGTETGRCDGNEEDTDDTSEEEDDDKDDTDDASEEDDSDDTEQDDTDDTEQDDGDDDESDDWDDASEDKDDIDDSSTDDTDDSSTDDSDDFDDGFSAPLARK